MAVTEDGFKPPRVRPGFLKWSAVAFAMLLPFVVYTAWDFVETRRLNARLDAIRQRGEPWQLYMGSDLKPDEAQAERLYRAAGALTSGYWKQIPSTVGFRMRQARMNWEWPADVVDRLRSVLDRHRDALTLADRAAPLPFDGFAPGTSHNYRTSEMWAVQRLCSFRATVRVLDGDNDGALDSIYTGLRAGRAIEPSWASRGYVSEIVAILRHSRPSPAARARVATELAALDRDDLLTRSLMQTRLQAIDGLPRMGWRSTHWDDLVSRPWQVHRLNRTLDVTAALISAAERPWPEPLAAVPAVGLSPFPIRRDVRQSLESDARSAAQQIKDVRCARLLVSEEKLELIDPFTGKQLEVIDCKP